MKLRVLCNTASERDVILTATMLDDLMVAACFDGAERRWAVAMLEQAYRRAAALKEQAPGA